MHVFLDANILISVLNKEYPLFTFTARLLSLANDKRFTLYTSSLCLGIAFYFAEKKHGSTLAKQKITLLTHHIKISECGEKEVFAAIGNSKVVDFEDGLQYYSAINAKCNCIVSADLNGFYYADIEVLEPEFFLRKYLN
ncbi:MAG: PIN domain-containing protein [Bacteroidota bacterium]